MLDKLPPEVIVIISSFLNLQDKLILITTCHRLFDVISKTNLFSELDLYYHTKKMDKMLAKFTSSRYPGSLVKKLSFDISEIRVQSYYQLSTVFPNITRVKTHNPQVCTVFSHYAYIKNQTTWRRWTRLFTDYSKSPMIHWSKTLEVYKMQDDWPQVLPVFKMTTFPRLTVLELGFSHFLPDRKDGYDTTYFLPHIKNAPSLKRLTLSDCAIDLEFLDEVHASCPSLESLKLSHAHIIIRKDTLTQPIVPANSLLYLELFRIHSFDTSGLLLDYIPTKYPCLKQLGFGFEGRYYLSHFNQHYRKHDMNPLDDDDDDDNDDDDDSESEQADLNSPTLQGMVQKRRSSVYNIKWIIAEYNQIYNSLENEHEKTMQVYKQLGSIFFSNLTTSIKSIIIEYGTFGNNLELLASLNTKIVDLAHRRPLETVDQIQYITSIPSLKTLSIGIKFKMQTNLQVFPCENISKLNISVSGHEVNFDWLLSTFPSLQELYIEGGDVWTTSDNSDHTYPNLKSFRAEITDFDQMCIDFLIRIAPNLKVLNILVDWFKVDSGMREIDISGWNLKEFHLEYTFMYFEGNYYYHIRTPYLDEVIKYSPKLKSVALVDVDSFADPPPLMLEITSNKNEHFRFLNHQLSLTPIKLILTPCYQ